MRERLRRRGAGTEKGSSKRTKSGYGAEPPDTGQRKTVILSDI